MERVREDLQSADLVVAAEAPDMHHRQLGTLIALLNFVMAEHNDRVAILEELVGGERELVPRPHGVLKDLDGRVLALMRAPTGHVL